MSKYWEVGLGKKLDGVDYVILRREPSIRATRGFLGLLCDFNDV
jgi:hypothetical protein